MRARETAAGGPSAAGGAHVTPEEQVDATTPVTDGTSEDTESSSAPADSSEPTPTGSDEAGPGAVADRSDADAPGIQTLEADESGDAAAVEKPDGDAGSGENADRGAETARTTNDRDEASGDEDGEPPADLTREDPETLAGTDLDDLTGTDVTLDGSKDDGESDGEPTDHGGIADEVARTAVTRWTRRRRATTQRTTVRRATDRLRPVTTPMRRTQMTVTGAWPSTSGATRTTGSGRVRTDRVEPGDPRRVRNAL